MRVHMHTNSLPLPPTGVCSGAYFKYSSGGTPLLLWALGYGFEQQDDFDEVYRFKWVGNVWE